MTAKTITVTTPDGTKTSRSSNTVGEILESIYAQNNIQPDDIKDGHIDSKSTSWVEATTKINTFHIEIETEGK